MSMWKIAYVYWPRRLAITDHDGSMRFIGWVWMQKAFLTNNFNHGWIAFVDNQTEKNLETCPCCKRQLNGGVA